MFLKKTLYHLTGDYADFKLEFRIFHSFCIVAIVTLAYCVPLNFMLGLPASAWLSLAAMTMQCVLFYLSRFRGRTKLSLALSIIIIHCTLIVNYYYNAGLEGPTLLLLLTIFFLVSAVSDPKEYKYWITLNIAVAAGLPLLEYYRPTQIQSFYTSRFTQFADMVSSYCLCSITLLMGLRYIKRNYDQSQQLLKTKAEDLERINQTKNKMFSIVSHDLRAPIASIQGYLELLSQMDIDNQDRQRIKDDLMQMTQNTDIMLSNLLMWSTSQMEGMVMDRKTLNLKESIMPVVQVLKSIANSKGLGLTCNIDAADTVFADQNMLQLVIRNILSNAIKFTHPGGRIDILSTCKGMDCELKISDTGVGMSDKIKESVFSIKGESSYGTRNEKGVGLGLSLSKEFTELQGGSIHFESEADKGTVFYITMPASDVSKTAPRVI